ncbi:hypothetical protein GJ496_011456 [Pomphorhynchus laevis]|nr:hypothetical protein GJ496_011456 [Pomphorhynchus laevis]
MLRCANCGSRKPFNHKCNPFSDYMDRASEHKPCMIPNTTKILGFAKVTNTQQMNNDILNEILSNKIKYIENIIIESDEIIDHFCKKSEILSGFKNQDNVKHTYRIY